MRVTKDRWRDAMKFLMGLGTGPSLTAADQRDMKKVLRGPFKDGMSMAEATRYLRDGLKWEKENV